MAKGSTCSRARKQKPFQFAVPLMPVGRALARVEGSHQFSGPQRAG